MFAAAVALAPFAAFAANTYYVNPNPELASDGYDGTAAVWAGGDSKVGPKLTLQGAMSIPGIRTGDTVYAAAGDYDMGGAESQDGASNRVVVVGGVRLIGAGADKTTIKGALGDGENGIGPGAMRAVYLHQYAVIQGFTITGGRTESAEKVAKNCGAAVAGVGGLVADCSFVGNNAGYRGSAATGNNTLLRCYIGDNDGEQSLYDRVRIFDSVCDCANSLYSGIVACNCLFVRASPTGSGVSARVSLYNSIILEHEGWYTDFHNCRLAKKIRTSDNNSTNADGCSIDGIANLGKMYDPQTFRPNVGSELIDAGNNSYYSSLTSNWYSGWHEFAGKDFAGRVRKFGSSIDIGPGEYDWRDGTVAGIEAEAVDMGDGTMRVVVKRDFESEKLCTGFTFGEMLVEFDKNGIGGAWTNFVPSASITENSLVPVFASETAHWYVNPDPLVGDDKNRGYHRDCPFFTLQKAAALAVSGNVIHAAPGVYRDGGTLVGDTMTRVKLNSGVGLVSDCGAENTAIEGFLSSEPGMSGEDSVRCVSVDAGAYVKGFTIRNGSTRVGKSDVYGDNGGGVYGAGAAIDCVITNCYAVRGSGSCNSILIRCRMSDCKPSTGATNASGQVAKDMDVIMQGGCAYDSHIAKEVYTVSEIRNSRVAKIWGSGGYTRVYNSYVENDFGKVAYTNCVVAIGLRDTCVADDATMFRKNIQFDGDMRPNSVDSLAVDKGDASYYVYPAAFAHEAGKDISGGQRIYNGALDIGPGEYDWRRIFTERLNRRGVSVDAASAGVMSAEVEGLTLQEGDTLNLALIFKNGGTCSFKVVTANGGSATVSADGTVLTCGDDEVYTFSGSAEDVHMVSITCGSGSATVCGFKMPGFGMVVKIR